MITRFQYCSNDAIPNGPNDPDYRDKMSKLVPCGDFPTEDECVNVLGIVFDTLCYISYVLIEKLYYQYELYYMNIV